jgi:hypothetical protein
MQEEDDSALPHFIASLWHMVDDHSTDDLISWAPDGRSFIVKDKEGLQEQLLPIHFKHANFSSFMRQLNTYCFAKIGEINTYQWQHSGFRRGHKNMLTQIKRRQQVQKPINRGFGEDDNVTNMPAQPSIMSNVANISSAANENALSALSAVMSLEEKFEKTRIANEILERRVRELEIELKLGKQVQLQMSQRLDDMAMQVQGLFTFFFSRKGNYCCFDDRSSNNIAADSNNPAHFNAQNSSNSVAKRITMDQQKNSNGFVIPTSLQSENISFGDIPSEGFSLLDSEINSNQHELFRDFLRPSPTEASPFGDKMYSSHNSNNSVPGSNLQLEFPLRRPSTPESPLEDEFPLDNSMELCHSPRFSSMDFESPLHPSSSPIPFNRYDNPSSLFDSLQSEGMDYFKN